MPKELIIVNKNLLPKYFEKVLDAKQLLESGKAENVSAACQLTGISRSTFYKYQEDVFAYHEEKNIRKLVVSFMLAHRTGALNTVCEILSKYNVSIITISQSAPIGNACPVMLSLDISSLNLTIDEFRNLLEKIPEIQKLKFMSFE